MFKRLELHNHTTESDSSLTVQELIDVMVADKVDAFAITDHNTISGHQKVKQLLKEKNIPLSCIYGMELTTYYGHILCLNIDKYIPWENINSANPESLFHAAKRQNALVGIAHPFSYGAPFARGCRFDMTITDFTAFDFIEVFNDLESLHEVNEPALLWWEDLVLNNYSLAATCGMDLHGNWNMANQFATFIEGEPFGNISKEITKAILTQRTWISKGPILNWENKNDTLLFQIIDTIKPGYVSSPEDEYYLTLRTKKGTLCKRIKQHVPLSVPLYEFDKNEVIIPKLYHQNTTLENLVVIAPVINLS